MSSWICFCGKDSRFIISPIRKDFNPEWEGNKGVAEQAEGSSAVAFVIVNRNSSSLTILRSSSAINGASGIEMRFGHFPICNFERQGKYGLSICWLSTIPWYQKSSQAFLSKHERKVMLALISQILGLCTPEREDYNGGEIWEKRVVSVVEDTQIKTLQSVIVTLVKLGRHKPRYSSTLENLHHHNHVSTTVSGFDVVAGLLAALNQ